MQPINEQLTNKPSPPKGGSGVPSANNQRASSLVYISQDGLTAIPVNLIKFLYVPNIKPLDHKFALLAKIAEANALYDNVILFKHSNLEVVKRVLRFLASKKILIPADDLITINLPDLYKHGMEKIPPEILKEEC